MQLASIEGPSFRLGGFLPDLGPARLARAGPFLVFVLLGAIRLKTGCLPPSDSMWYAPARPSALANPPSVGSGSALRPLQRLHARGPCFFVVTSAKSALATENVCHIFCSCLRTIPV
jgi:hypothetical protein